MEGPLLHEVLGGDRSLCLDASKATSNGNAGRGCHLTPRPEVDDQQSRIHHEQGPDILLALQRLRLQTVTWCDTYSKSCCMGCSCPNSLASYQTTGITSSNLMCCLFLPPAAHYRGPRMVLAAAGAVDHEALVGLAEKTFGVVPDETPETSVASLVAKVRILQEGSCAYDCQVLKVPGRPRYMLQRPSNVTTFPGSVNPDANAKTGVSLLMAKVVANTSTLDRKLSRAQLTRHLDEM